MSLSVDVLTDIGLERMVNEDAFYSDAKRRLFFVCDGMGGHRAGDIASFLAVEIVSGNRQGNTTEYIDYKKEDQYDENGNNICNKIKYANYAIYMEGINHADYLGMGTTIALLYFSEGNAYIAHVGDSRVYFISEAEMIQKTKDHTWVQEQVDLGAMTPDEAQTHPMRNVITQALGQYVDVTVDVHIGPKESGFYLLCTDGLSSLVSDDKIHAIVWEYRDNLHKACLTLVQEAKNAGGSDNITVILVKYTDN